MLQLVYKIARKKYAELFIWGYVSNSALMLICTLYLDIKVYFAISAILALVYIAFAFAQSYCKRRYKEVISEPVTLTPTEAEALDVFRKLTGDEQREEIGAIKRTISARKI